MNNKVFVGNLPWSVTNQDLSKVLDDEGFTYQSVKVINDKDTGRSRGFAFVEFNTEEEAKRSIAQLTGYLIDGRPIFVSEARQKTGSSRPGRGAPPQGDRSSGQQEPRGADKRRSFSPPKPRTKNGHPHRSHSRGGDSYEW